MVESHVHNIVRRIGSETIAEALGVTVYSIRAAKRERKFSARWYKPLKRLGEANGVHVPMSAFNWLDPDKKSIKADGRTPPPSQPVPSDTERCHGEDAT